MSLLKVTELHKSYGSLKILNNVNLKVNRDERHVIIGPNGAGKTTLFNCITGTVPINQGIIEIKGINVSHIPSFKKIEHGMSRTFQKNNLFLNFTVEENLQLAVMSRKNYRFRIFKPLFSYKDIKEETDQLLNEWNLYDRKNVLVDELSYGEQRLLEILLALALKPQLLLLDEPTSGMSPAETMQTIRLIQNLPRTVSLLVVEHDMEVVFSIADRITVLHHGEVILTGTPDEVKGDQTVTEIYFGGGAKKNVGA